MEKLLHERLREFDGESPTFLCADGFNAGISQKAAQHLADEIERFYIPCSRDQDGTPWKVGDPCIHQGREAYIHGFGSGDGVNIKDAYECDPPLYIWVNKDEISRPLGDTNE